MGTHSSTLAWKIPWTEEPGGLHSMGHKESDTTEGPNNNSNSLESLMNTDDNSLAIKIRSVTKIYKEFMDPLKKIHKFQIKKFLPEE